MTEAKLREIQQINNTKNMLAVIQEHMREDDPTNIVIITGYADMTYSEMHVKLYPEFYEDFATFIRQQWCKYKEAFDNA